MKVVKLSSPHFQNKLRVAVVSTQIIHAIKLLNQIGQKSTWL